MEDLLKNAGFYVYPLGIFSCMAFFVIIERLIALRHAIVMPDALVKSILTGEVFDMPEDKGSAGGRIVSFLKEKNPDAEALKAFAQWEVSRLERGLFILDIVVAAAPLLGLLGTVHGLIGVFSHFSPDTGLLDPNKFIEGASLALTTTMLGLGIAIPALVGNSYLTRRVDVLAARLYVGVERLIDLSKKRA